jgi:hypothetical protein
MPRGPTRRIRGRAGKLRCVAAPESSRIKDLAAASDAVAEIHAGYYVVAGTAFKVVLLAVFGLDVKSSPAPPGSASLPGPPGGCEVRPFRTFCEPLTQNFRSFHTTASVSV